VQGRAHVSDHSQKRHQRSCATHYVCICDVRTLACQ
jgi:hypothetical protein